jgi:hypothetical protein
MDKMFFGINLVLTLTNGLLYIRHGSSTFLIGFVFCGSVASYFYSQIK